MSTTAFLFEAIKAHLRSRSLTYADLAGGLGVSEGTVKRIFSRRRCSTEQLDAICAFLQLELPDLVRTLPRPRRLLEQLTWKQEEEVTADTKLFVVAVCALHLLRVEEMLQYYDLDEAECVSKLLTLEHIGFLELHPGNRYRLLVARTFRWIPGGPIAQLAKRELVDFFDHSFDEPGELLQVLNVRISDASRVSLLSRLQQVVESYNEQHVADAGLPLAQRRPVSVWLAVRSWEPRLFKALRRAAPASHGSESPDHAGAIRPTAKKSSTGSDGSARRRDARTTPS
ncbi:MAG: helix-turn-helix transcriptional regulator [Burkholderiaceae bacterium]|nr:helix-turn-helix transcriptional regulator [Burkholderiaceae bacterium]